MIFGATSTDMHLFHNALVQWGLEAQIYKTFEEIAELNVELARGLIKGSVDLGKVADEIADVYIMLHQLAHGLGINEGVNERVNYKMERLVEILAHEIKDDSQD
jgi:NTP pyrophosphatase (non-canonical NTP hydrolase)